MTEIFNKVSQIDAMRRSLILKSVLKPEVLGNDNGTDGLKARIFQMWLYMVELQYVHYTRFATAAASNDMRNSTPVIRPYKTTFFKILPTLSKE